MRFAVDTGGTFTDLVIEDDSGTLHMFKAHTTPHDPSRGILNAVQSAADGLFTTSRELLGRAEIFIHGTTHGINAILTGNTARTAFLTTKGHPDILVLREGGRIEPFNYSVPFPKPYIPRALTFEVPERISWNGKIVQPLDEGAVLGVMSRLKELKVEAVGVCLLWSTVNPAHEKRVGALLEQYLPGVPFTLSHVLNPIMREYRRASSACIDASLKPLMTRYLGGLSNRLKEAGFKGRLLMLTSKGGVMDFEELAAAPIHSIGSGPSVAPIAGSHYAKGEAKATAAIVADTGGTSYDVSLVRRGVIPMTPETWIGQRYRGHIIGFPSVDTKSIGAGGGSIAWVDAGGLLHVGPQSAGAVPGPACYGKGGSHPTVTDASLVLGHVDSAFFLGGAMKLDPDLSVKAIDKDVGRPLGLGLYEAASAILRLATENMVGAIEEITIKQGMDPREAVLVGGGGAAGLNVVAIARRLGCSTVIVPELGAALSAAGALMSDLHADYRALFYTATDNFDFDGANAVLQTLEAKCLEFIKAQGAEAENSAIELPQSSQPSPHAPGNPPSSPLKIKGERGGLPKEEGEGAAGIASTSPSPLVGEGWGEGDQKGNSHTIEFFAEARYRGQIWEIDLPLRHSRFKTAKDVACIRQDFDKMHQELFAFCDPGSEVQLVGWHATARCRIRERELGKLGRDKVYEAGLPQSRQAYFSGTGMVETRVELFDSMKPDVSVAGPAIIESPFTTVVIDPGATVVRKGSGNLVITP